MTRERRPDRALGSPHDAFWSGCAEGVLRLQRCGVCSRLSWPAVLACEHCGATSLTWEAMSGRGRLLSWCRFERDYYEGLMVVPYDAILVELDEGALFLSNPSGFGWGDFRPGLELRLAFLPCEDSAGPFELPVFERA